MPVARRSQQRAARSIVSTGDERGTLPTDEIAAIIRRAQLLGIPAVRVIVALDLPLSPAYLSGVRADDEVR
jgi:hypothetical protein